MLRSKFFRRKNHTATRSTQCFVCCRCCYMSIWNRAFMITGSNQSCDMSHIYHQISTNFICNFTKSFEINLTAVSTCTGNNHFRFALFGNALYFVIINKSCVIHTVRYDVIIGSGNICRASMRKMSAVVKVHSHNCLTRFNQSKEYSHVCLGTGMWLNICISTAKQFLCAVSCQIFHDVHILASAIITFARITFCIFVCQCASHSSHYGFADKVF